MGVVAARAKRVEIFVLHIHGIPRKGSRGTLGTKYTMLCMDIQYTHLLHREDQARLSLSAKLHVLVSYSAGSLGTRLRERLLHCSTGAQAEVAGARAPVCPSLATPLGIRGAEKTEEARLEVLLRLGLGT